MVIAPGARLGPYELAARIGAGGMGEVWRARDTRLGRSVAVKILPPDFARDPQSRSRFEREARTISQLEHPSICRLYDVGEIHAEEQPESSYLVMELLEGDTLRVKLAAAGTGQAVGLPVRKALEYTRQLGEGLAAAHERGIVHRDLKPENIFITREGRVKILDFGLAKEVASHAPGASQETAWADTSPGVVVGTAAYMSPEQVRAAEVDHRSDLFAVGVILFEMVTGRRPFQGRSGVETMNAILTADPPALDRSAGAAGPGLDSIVRRLLEKDPHERFQSARDVTFAIDAISTPSGTAVPVAPATSRPFSRPATVATAVLVGLALGVAAMRFFRPAQSSASFVRRLTFGAGLEYYPALSPDGKTFLFVSSAEGNPDIYLQRVDGRNAINLTKDSRDIDQQPAFSQDGSQIAFRSSRDGGGIFVMGATGESVRRLTTFGYNPSWSPDASKIVFSTESVALNPRGRTPPAHLWTVDVRSGSTRQLTKRDAVQPSWSPHGHRIAFWGLPTGGAQRDVLTIDPDAADPDSTAVQVTNDAALDWNPVWSSDGTTLYFGSDRGGSMNLWRIGINEKSGRVTGAPESVTLPTPFAAHFGIAGQPNALIFTSVLSTTAIERYALEAGDGAERPVTIFSSALGITGFDVSPDGRRIALSATTGSQEDLFLMNSDGSRIEQLTNDAAPDRGPVWSGDGRLIYFYSQRGDRYETYTVRPDGGGLTQITRSPTESTTTPRPSSDGKQIVLATNTGSILWDVRTSRYETLPTPDPKHVITDARWSADGRRLVALESPAGDINTTSGIVLYDFESKTYKHVADDPAYALAWVRDDAIAFATSAGLTVLNLTTGKRREIHLETVAAGPRSIAASSDGRFIYVRTTRNVGDVFLTSFSSR